MKSSPILFLYVFVAMLEKVIKEIWVKYPILTQSYWILQPILEMPDIFSMLEKKTVYSEFLRLKD